LWVSFSPVTSGCPENFVTGRKAPADRIQPGVAAKPKKKPTVLALVFMIKRFLKKWIYASRSITDMESADYDGVHKDNM
jgi:hypothetical protein